MTVRKTISQKFKALSIGRKIAAVVGVLAVLFLISVGSLAVIGFAFLPEDTPSPSAMPVLLPKATVQKTALPTATRTPTASPTFTSATTLSPTLSPAPTRTPAPKMSKPPVKKPQTKAPSATQSPRWSDWLTDLPSGITESDYIIESKAQYRAIIYTWKEARTWDCTHGAWQDGVKDAYDPWDVCYTFVAGQNYTGTETRTVYRYKLR